ncbi:hypothetical protein ACFOEK_10765 [Litoribrevibacter euphylliae]|uniref:Uncharacterized protein n=1 Tax=Litoribrevibacter euphylliae TaxID=1834034 RepID=A0ABV7HFX1_9GAMM
MSSTMDLRYEALQRLGFEGTTSDMLLQYWRSQGGVGEHINDVWFSALGVLGRTEATLTDRWYAYLASLGYEGHVWDAEFLYWSNL